MNIYSIKIPGQQNPDEFETFLREEYLPAIHKQATRKGQVTGFALLRSNSEETEFLWLVSDLIEGTPQMNDDSVNRKFDSLGATIDVLGRYLTVEKWQEENVF
jgi:hypothetical protein